tara:strand:+ start:223 stop:837 length:615 start_codon:yes stop_codon:yes gene_type:complete
MKLTKQTLRSLIKEVVTEKKGKSMLLSEQIGEAALGDDQQPQQQERDSYDEIIDILEGKNSSVSTIGIMSGQNPRAQPTAPDVNARLDSELKQDLMGIGLKFIAIGGMFGSPEDSVLILNPTRDQMHDLNRKYQQWGYVWGQDLPKFMMMQINYDSDQGEMVDPNSVTATTVIKHEDAANATDYYSYDIKTGKKFIIPLYGSGE